MSTTIAAPALHRARHLARTPTQRAAHPYVLDPEDPPALFITGVALLAVGAARPQASATIPLALDTSGSMCSTDVDPNRITAAKKAAADFIESPRGGPPIGLVTFASTAGLLIPPTDDTDSLIDALDDLIVSRGTAIGQPVLTSIDAIAEGDLSVPPPARAHRQRRGWLRRRRRTHSRMAKISGMVRIDSSAHGP
ncbi:VWA domain-containing protein [Nonomuraea sp. NPDC003709]|uniref:VWA domain-containing protein n=1 Tax=Nonomuraea sp. NPDC003709 TaxID=3154450 RepID=UPI0033B9493B